jgi:hypothetical protein
MMPNCTQKTPKRLNTPGVVTASALSRSGIHILFKRLHLYYLFVLTFADRYMIIAKDHTMRGNVLRLGLILFDKDATNRIMDTALNAG